jgi:hypothetical protein
MPGTFERTLEMAAVVVSQDFGRQMNSAVGSDTVK